MKPIALILAIAIASLFIFNESKAHVSAQVIPTYSYEYAATNFYSEYPLSYEISGLNIALAYSWTIYAVDDSTGAITRALGRIDHPAGVSTSKDWIFGVGDGVGHWPDRYTGPVKVLDNNGATLGTHYITPLTTTAGTTEWYAAGAQALNEKLIIGNRNTSGDCQTSFYSEINLSGWLHDEIPCKVTTFDGDYALLHFQYDFTTYSAPSVDTIVVFSINSGTLIQDVAIDLDDLIEYQTTAGFSLNPNPFTMPSFVILNTSSELLPFIDNELSDQKFGSTYQSNPHRFGQNPTLAGALGSTGVFTCAAYQGATITHECESLWLVTQDTALNEWEISAPATISDSGTINVAVTERSVRIWLGLHGIIELNDSVLGNIDSNIYAWTDSTLTQSSEWQYSYTVDSSAAYDVEVEYRVEPAALYAGAAAATSDRQFAVATTYEIISTFSAEEGIAVLIDSSGFSTEAGRTFIHAMFISFGLATVAALKFTRTMFGAYTIAWTIFGALPASLSFAHSDLSLLLYVVTTILLWVLTLASGTLVQMNGTSNDG